MAYQNKSRGSRGSYNKGGGGGRNNGGNRQFSKRTGANRGTDKNGNPYFTGWRVTRFGMVKYLCVPTSKTSEHTTQNGKPFHNWMVKIQPENMPEFTESCLYYPGEGLVRIPGRNLVIKPSAPNGGYCGKPISSSGYGK